MPGLTPQSITQLYKTYGMGNPDQPLIDALMNGTGKYAKYNTPDSLTNLLSATQTDRKSKMLNNIDTNLQSLGAKSPANNAPQSLYGGQLPDFASYANANPDFQAANTGYNNAFADYNAISGRAGAAPGKTEDMLKAGSAFFGESRGDLEKKFGDPNSPWFIRDTATRDSVMSRAMDQKNQTMHDVVKKITDVYNVLTTASQNQLAGKKEQVDTMLKLVGKSYDALNSYLGQQATQDFQREQTATEHKNRLSEIYAGKSADTGTWDVKTINGMEVLLNSKSGDMKPVGQGGVDIALQSAGITRKKSNDGGYEFIGQDGSKIDYVKAADQLGLSPDKAGSLLTGSKNQQDIRAVVQASDSPFASASELSSTGMPFLNIDNYSGKDKNMAVNWAAQNGVAVLNKAEASVIKEVSNARENMNNILTAGLGFLPKSASSRTIIGPANVFAKLTQLDPRVSAFSAWRSAAIQSLRAMAGSKGLRINQAEIKLATENDLPKITDTQDVARKKIETVLKQLTAAENAALYKGNVKGPSTQQPTQQQGGGPSNDPAGIF
jgi:hypothetical protein